MKTQIKNISNTLQTAGNHISKKTNICFIGAIKMSIKSSDGFGNYISYWINCLGKWKSYCLGICSIWFCTHTLIFSFLPCRRINIGFPVKSLPVRHSSEGHFSISLMYFALDLMWSKCSKAVQVSSVDSGLISAESQLDVLIKSEKFSWSHSIKSWTMGSGGSDRAVSSKCSLRSWHCFLDKWLEVMLISGGVWG